MHSKPGMINVTNINTCKEIGCMKKPNYNIKGEKEGIYCKDHSTSDMVDVNHKKCIEKDCNTRPSYNYKGEKQPLYCKTHSKKDMADVISDICKEEGCNIKPMFNYKGEKKGLYCKSHALIDMVDVKNKRCIIDDCNTRPNYGYCGESPTRCSKHKDNVMFINPKRKCIGKDEEECNEIATYGIKEPTHCEEHSSINEISLVVSTCKKCGLKDSLVTRDKLCITYCSPTKLFEEYKKREKTKEILMLKYLDEYVNIEKHYKVQDDKILNPLCNLYRPDRIYDCLTHSVIVECDEEQHKKYIFCSSYKDLEHSELCRMHEIQNAVGLPCIFIRWNPDNFKINGKICKKYNMKDRLKTLVKWIEHCVNLVPEEDFCPVKYKKLFYDNYDETDSSFSIIDDIDNKLK
jgi:hypothetical protein